MTTNNFTVYLVASEDKDVYCLEPLIPALQEHFNDIRNIHLLDLLHDDSRLQDVCSKPWPIFLFNSRISIDFLSLVMGDKPYISIGLEHGIGPYKKYTYNRQLTECDIYFAPTTLWAERLTQLHQPPKGAVRVGGYPRLQQLLDRIEKARISSKTLSPKFWPGVATGGRKLVIFSWHLAPAELACLPDSANVVYLLHPADAYIVDQFRFQYASIVVSTPHDTAELLASADIVAGDFSSMTLEAAATGVTTYYFVDRSLYLSDCDMDPEFFQRNQQQFALIPYSSYQLSPEQIGNREQLTAILQNSNDENLCNLKPLNLASELFPPTEKGDGRYIAQSIKDYVHYLDKGDLLRESHSVDNREALNFVKQCYRRILNREADIGGATHYLRMILDTHNSRICNALQMIRDLTGSEEGMNHWSETKDIPFFK